MGIVIKQSFRNALSNYLGLVLGAVNMVILYPRIFADNPEYFGLIQLIISYSLVVSTFFNLGVPGSIIRFFPRVEKEQRPQLLGFLTLYPLPILLAIFALVAIFRETIIPLLSSDELFLENWWFVLPISMFFIYFEIFASIAQSHFKTVLPIFVKEVGRRLQVTALLILYGLQVIDLQWFLIIYLLGIVLQFLILVFYLMRSNMLKLSFGKLGLQKKTIVTYGLFVFITSGVNFLVNKIDNLMIASYVDLASVGYYSVAFFIGSVLAAPIKSLLHVTRPILSKAFADGDMAQVKTIYQSGGNGLMTIGLLLFVLIITNLTDIFYLLPKDYEGGEKVVFLIALAQLVNVATGQNGIIISLSKHYTFNLKAVVLLLILAVVNNILFIPSMGMLGAALATFISLLTFNVVKTIYLYNKLKMLPFNKDSLKLVPVFALCFVLGWYIDIFNNPIIDIIVRSILVCVVFLPLIYRLKVSAEINNILEKGLSYVGRK